MAEGIRRRFASLSAPRRAQVFRGRFDIVRRSRLGWCFAWLCRVIGEPLPRGQGQRVPARVVVALARDGKGVEWRRHYAFAHHGERCSTVKREAGRQLLECVGRCFGMELALSEEAGALHFRSTRFFVTLGRRRLTWPLLLSPGRMHVLHEAGPKGDGGDEDFRFRLEVRHPLFGLTFLQDGRFRQMEG
ncbi:MAG TPA: DUF4166 domain-containing protein [Kiloniellales bacterium]|nr:DUF4166 domain-containing protein [Kiloniellales bacterium]